jgi:muramoyltetrapeptide carboxypeptidase LdcA involved in peptidoglycan recycling
MTVSTADIPVLHSVEVAHIYPQVMLPICQETTVEDLSLNAKN